MERFVEDCPRGKDCVLGQGQRVKRKEQQRQPVTDHSPIPHPPVLLWGACREIMSEAELWKMEGVGGTKCFKI